jgi:hypothetical protein
MPERKRQRERFQRFGRGMHQMEIRVAGAGRADLHQHLTRARFRHGHLSQFGRVG